jgi:hypothetical protein
MASATLVEFLHRFVYRGADFTNNLFCVVVDFQFKSLLFKMSRLVAMLLDQTDEGQPEFFRLFR